MSDARKLCRDKWSQRILRRKERLLDEILGLSAACEEDVRIMRDAAEAELHGVQAALNASRAYYVPASEIGEACNECV